MIYPCNFTDGPAMGVQLQLKRSPFLLRVVVDAAGNVDALDQINDTARPDEQIHVYWQLQQDAPVHVQYQSPGGQRRSDYFCITQYQVYGGPTISHDVIRHNALWRSWTKANIDAIHVCFNLARHNDKARQATAKRLTPQTIHQGGAS